MVFQVELDHRAALIKVRPLDPVDGLTALPAYPAVCKRHRLDKVERLRVDFRAVLAKSVDPRLATKRQELCIRCIPLFSGALLRLLDSIGERGVGQDR